MSKTHYELLGIPPTASYEDIQASYLRAIAFNHPDRNKSKNAVEMTQLVNQAYDTLNDPIKKIHYDLKLNTDLLTLDTQQIPPQESKPTNSKDRVRRIPKFSNYIIKYGFFFVITCLVIVIIIFTIFSKSRIL